MLIVPNWIIIAVLCLVACLFPQSSLQLSRSSRHPGNTSEIALDWSQEGEESQLMSVEAGSRWLSPKEAQAVLRKEGGEKGLPVDCCPSTLEMVEPQGGINQDGLLVTLFSEGENKQRFFELSCRDGVENKPCRFMDRKLHNQSRCVQKYSYTYAIVRSHHSEQRTHHFPSFPSAGSNWMLDYIRVRSGCSCEVLPRVRRRRPNKRPHRGKKHSAHSDEDNV